MSALHKQQETDILHFSRLMRGKDGKEADRQYESTDHIKHEYVPDYSRRVSGRFGSPDQMQPAWDRLVEYALYDLAQVLSREEMEKVQTGLTSPDFKTAGELYVKVHTWAKTHPEEAARFPMIHYIAVTPPTLGYLSRLFDDHRSDLTTSRRRYGFTLDKQISGDREAKKKIDKILKQATGPVGEELRTRFQERLELTAAEEMAWALAQGGIPHLGIALRRYQDEVSMERDSSYPEEEVQKTKDEIRSTLPIVKAAIGLRGERWTTEAPEQLRLLTKEYVELEWLLENPVLAKEDIPLLESVIAHAGKVMDIGQTVVDHHTVLSWPMVLHKLTFEPDRARLQWEKQVDSPGALLKEPEIWDDPDTKRRLGEILAPVIAEMWEQQIGIDQADFVQNIIRQALTKDGIGEKKLHIYPLLDDINKFQAAKADPDHAAQYMSGERSHDVSQVVKQVGAVVKEWYWKAKLIPLREALLRAVVQPDAVAKVGRLSPGYFKNLCEYLILEQQGDASPAEMTAAMERMRAELGDGADVNRAQDVMNGYVRQHYSEGTVEGKKWRADMLLAERMITEQEADELVNKWGTNWPWYDYKKAHAARKARFTEESASYPSTRDLQVFSDLVQRGDTEQMVDPLYKPRFLVRTLNPQIEDCARRLIEGSDMAGGIQQLKAEVLRLAPEKSLLRDYLLENIAHMELWTVLQRTNQTGRFAAEGIRLGVRTIDLDHHLGKNDRGVMAEAYMRSYPVVRVEGIARALYVFTVEEKKLIADFLTDESREMTPVTSELFERLAVELEIDHLRADYTQTRERLIPAGAEVATGDRIRAADLAFDEILGHVIERFPRATYHRDSILFALMTDLATTLPQIQKLEKLTYGYMVRHPGEVTDGATATFSVSESVKNYLALFQSREMRCKVLSWFFGGEVPDDRFLEGSTFKVNEQEKVEAFWAMSKEERRAIFYSGLLGEHGLFQVPSFDMGRTFESIDARFRSLPDAVRGEKGVVDLLEFLHNFYNVNLASIFTDKKKERAFKIAFFETFTRYSAVRRVELFLSIAERLRELKREKATLTPGDAISLLLEQGGVVSVKAGQVMSEQKDLVPDDIRADLSSLKDRREGFNKRGVFTYAQQGRLFEEVAGQPRIVEIGELEGSASIKQVHRVVTDSGEELAYKVERPSIDKNYAEDLQVLQFVVERFNTEGIHVPSWIVKEITQLVEAEMDFGKEARNAESLRTNLEHRSATLTVGGKDVPLKTPQVKMVISKTGRGRRRVQMMLEEFARGLSVADIIRLQQLERTNAQDEKSIRDRERINRKLHRLRPGQERELWRRYVEIDIEEVQAGLAIEQLYEIAEDGIFHADMHDGNVIVNAVPGEESASLIDAGSAGDSGEKERFVGTTFVETLDARTDFLDFGVNILLLKSGLGDQRRVAEVVGRYVNGSVDYWEREVGKAVAKGETVGEVFKELLAEIMRVTEGNLDLDFRYAVKALASSGGHLEALKNRIQGHILAAFAAMDTPGALPPQIALMNTPEIRRLLPLLPRMPTLAGMLGALIPSA